MGIHIHIHQHTENESLIIQKLNKIMSDQAQLAQDLRDLKEQNDKSRAEVLQRFAELEAAIVAAGNTTPEVDEALAALKTSIQTDDDLIADAPPVEPPAEPV